tara:strand:- start:79 stop:543 length:465 start_codon:yes stop_codon:yes gene_type:complete
MILGAATLATVPLGSGPMGSASISITLEEVVLVLVGAISRNATPLVPTLLRGMRDRINVGEYGDEVAFCAKENISASTCSLVFRDPHRVDHTVTATVATVELETERGLFPANQYVTYTIESGLFDIEGTWKAQLVCDFGTKKQTSDWKRFKVRK